MIPNIHFQSWNQQHAFFNFCNSLRKVSPSKKSQSKDSSHHGPQKLAIMNVKPAPLTEVTQGDKYSGLIDDYALSECLNLIFKITIPGVVLMFLFIYAMVLIHN